MNGCRKNISFGEPECLEFSSDASLCSQVGSILSPSAPEGWLSLWFLPGGLGRFSDPAPRENGKIGSNFHIIRINLWSTSLVPRVQDCRDGGSAFCWSWPWRWTVRDWAVNFVQALLTLVWEGMLNWKFFSRPTLRAFSHRDWVDAWRWTAGSTRNPRFTHLGLRTMEFQQMEAMELAWLATW